MEELITYVIVAIAFVYAGWQVYKTLKPRKEDAPGCGSGCGCDSVQLKKEIMRRKLQGN